MRDYVGMADLIGKKFEQVYADDDSVTFFLEDGTYFKLEHIQDCCEQVYIESIVGDLSDLEGSEILVAEEVDNADGPALSEYEESYTWTFYKLATRKGYVDIRFYGSSNGYYSESASLQFYP